MLDVKSPLKVVLGLITFAFFAAGLLLNVHGQFGANYAAVEAKQHIGENATITDKVDGVHQSGKGNIFLNMGGKYPNQTFTAWIPSGSAAQFPNPQQYEGGTVSVSG